MFKCVTIHQQDPILGERHLHQIHNKNRIIVLYTQSTGYRAVGQPTTHLEHHHLHHATTCQPRPVPT